MISVLRNHGRLDARSAMSSLFHSVAGTIAKSITAGMQLPGGTRPASIRPLPLARCGYEYIRCRQIRIILSHARMPPMRNGFEAQRAEFGNLVTKGIIDPI